MSTEELTINEILKEYCEFDFVEKDIYTTHSGGEQQYERVLEIHIKSKDKTNLLLNCITLHPKTQYEFSILKEALK